MKRVTFVFEMPHKNEYVGGIASILKQYMCSASLFEREGVSVRLLDLNCIHQKKRYSIYDRIVILFNERKKLISDLDNNNPDIYHFHTSIRWTLFKDLFIIKKIKRRYSGKIVLSIHFAEINKILPKNRLLRAWELKVLKNCCDQIVFLSEETKREFVDIGIPVEKATLLYTFHSFNNEINDKFISKASKQIRLIFMGSIDKRKGILDLLDAVERLDREQYHLDICGQITNDEMAEEFNNKISFLKDNVTFHGYVSGKEKEELLVNADALVLPSYGEGMPIVIMEGMSLGCAIISTSVGSIPEIIRQDNGILIQPGDINALYQALVFLISNKDILQKIKRKNMDYSQTFSLKSNISMICKTYKRILNSNE